METTTTQYLNLFKHSRRQARKCDEAAELAELVGLKDAARVLRKRAGVFLERAAANLEAAAEAYRREHGL